MATEFLLLAGAGATGGILSQLLANRLRAVAGGLRSVGRYAEARSRNARARLPTSVRGSGLRPGLASRFESGRFSSLREAPPGYEFASLERTEVRVYGADGLTRVELLAPFQNHCLSFMRRFAFRSLGGARVRVVSVGGLAYSSDGVGPLTLDGADVDLARDLIAFAPKGLMTLSGCESVGFAGDPEQPNALNDLVVEVATFVPVS